AGADAIKFQTFKAENLVSRNAPKSVYQKNTTRKKESQFEMLRKLELDFAAHKEIYKYCRKKGIDFLSSPFDMESIDLLYELGLMTFKIPSGEINNLPYLRKIGRLKRNIIMSSGMSSLTEIADALSILKAAGTPKEYVTVLHCNTEYPTPHEDVNLRAMLTIKKMLNVDVGYSDHTLGIEVPIAATAMGASIIEKHFTLDRKLKGPDHKASLEPEELEAMVKAIRNIEKSVGDEMKKVSPSEAKNKDIVRKSIVAARPIKRGEPFSEENITVKRPGKGISPMRWDDVIGHRAWKDFEKDELIQL
ncbi:MAG: N-acetylneuraminate synthase, partial [Candidatus Omnitrophota bacterium]